MAIAASQAGDRQPEHSFLQSTRAFCKLLYEIGSPEVRCATFIFENTICYQEFDTAKHITLDEFVNGRKRVNGTRFTDGCHIADRANVNRALQNLENQQHVVIDVEAHDGARKKRFYRLTLPSLDSVVSQDYKDEGTTPIVVVPQDYEQEQEQEPIVVSQDYKLLSPKTTPSSPPRLLDQSKYLKEELKESTSKTPEPTAELASIAPPARTSDDVPLWSQEMFSEKRKALRTLLQQVRDLRHAGAPASDYLPLQAQADTLEATITHQTDLLLSDSQGPDNASAGGLHETAQADEQADTPQEDMFTAVAHALGYPDTRRMNTSARNTVGKAKKEFEQVGVKPGQVDTVVRSYRASNRNFNIWAFLSELPKYATAALGGA